MKQVVVGQAFGGHIERKHMFEKTPIIFLSVSISLSPFPRRVGQGRRDVLCDVVGGLKTKCIYWALGFMLVPLTFLHFPPLYQIHFCICCNFYSQKQIMQQLCSCQDLSIRTIFFIFVCSISTNKIKRTNNSSDLRKNEDPRLLLIILTKAYE